jgi:carboxyl-terminal processing protease
MDFYAQEDKIKAYIKANIAEQLFSPNLSAEIKGEYDAMLNKVLELDTITFDQPEVGAAIKK